MTKLTQELLIEQLNKGVRKFHNCDLSDLDLSDLDLSYCDFDYVNFQNMTFTNCNLESTCFKFSDLRHTKFIKSYLSGTMFFYSDLTSVNLQTSECINIDFYNSAILLSTKFNLNHKKRKQI